MSLEEAVELFKLPKTLSPYKDQEVLVGIGRFGPYVKHGEAFISIPRGEDPLEITDERAIEIIEAKAHEDRPITTYKDKPVSKGKGRFGPFLKWEGTFVNIPKKIDPDDITPKQVIELLEAKLEKEANRYIQQWDKEKIAIENGRWGPFIRKGKKSVGIPKIDGERMSQEVAAQLTLEEVKEILEGSMPASVKKKMEGK
ncbi:MAG: topoisomerase C-terminal repeat-containing protein [Saprospiraceae bacterium]